MFVNIDDRNRIIAWNPGDLSDNTDWKPVPETIGDPITNMQGVPLYKYQGGHAVARSAAEIEADTPAPEEPQPSEMDVIKQRLDEQDDALIELAALIGG